MTTLCRLRLTAIGALGLFTFTSQFLRADCVRAPSGLVAWWRAEGSALDHVGAHHGVTLNGTTFAPGKIGQAFGFDGMNDLVQIADAPDLNPATITLEAWVNPSTINEDSRIISKDLQAGSCNAPYVAYSLDIRGDQGRRATFYFTTTNNSLNQLSGTSVIPTNQFTHLAATYDGTTARLYVNGVLEGSLARTGPIITSATPLTIGNAGAACRTSFAGQVEFVGMIDEVSLYNRALTTGEIQAIFNAGSAGKCPPQCVPVPTGCVAWWRAENNALDSFANNHGTLQNGVTFTAGMVGQVFQFDGTNDLVGLGDNSPLRRADAITYTFWARLPSDGGGPVLGVGAAGGQGFGGVHLDRTNFFFTWTPSAPNSDANLVALGVSVSSDQWTHFAVTVNYTNQAGAIYINGQALSSVVTNLIAQPIVNWTPNGQYNAGRDDFIGGRFVNTQQFFKGQLDELDIYSRALTAAEIQTLFNASSAGKCVGPALNIAPLPGAVRLTWSTNATGYLLETNSALTFPAGWGVLTSNYSVLNTNFAVTNALNGATRFYRLFKP